MPGSFVDTNVVVYFASADPARAVRARGLLEEGPTISVQVLNETAHVARRKMKLDWAEVSDILARVQAAAGRVEPVTIDTHELGIRLAERYRIAVHDATLVAAALLSDCTTFWSEDMHDGLVVEGRLTIRNPFA